jgi:hypothetical protein
MILFMLKTTDDSVIFLGVVETENMLLARGGASKSVV